MKNILFICVIGFISMSSLQAQKYFTKTGEISFYSHTLMEDIEAISKSASTVYDVESGKIQWAVLVKSFEFEKALMQEHFNENYMESSSFPKASFKGLVVNNKEVNLQKDGTYSAEIEGELLIHGIKNQVNVPAIFNVKEGIAEATCSFKVLVADYGIDIPSVVKDNIAKEIEITIKATYAILD